MSASARPLVPSDVDLKRSVARAAYSAFRAAGSPLAGGPEAICANLYGRDLVAGAVLRAATTGATTGASGWASELVPRATAEFIASLGPRSAAAEIIKRGTLLRLDGVGSIGIPTLPAPPAAAAWVSESGAIPVRAYSISPALLTPKKMAVIFVLSWELSRFSDADRVFADILRETGAVSLDSAYFSTAAASSSAHQGLLYNVTPIVGSASMIADMSKVAAAVSGPGSSGQVVFVAAPSRAAFVAMSPDVNATVLPSSVVPADRLIGIDPLSLIHGHDGQPDISASADAVLHMEDTNPLNIATGAQGSGVLATPTQSMLQTAQIANRLLLSIGFQKRRTDAVAFANGCTW